MAIKSAKTSLAAIAATLACLCAAPAASAEHAVRADKATSASNAAPAMDATSRAPITILISIDGFRADYLERGLTPQMQNLADQGAIGKLRPSFPTKTFPNHYALITGKRPDRNGIVGNNMVDPRRPNETFSLGDPKQALDPFWWNEAEPLWITAEQQGVRTATMFWPGSEVPFHDQRPRDWMRFDSAISNEQRVNTVLDWARRPADIRPAFITLYFDTVDTAGHRFGADSREVNDAIADVDQKIGQLLSGLTAMQQPARLILVADHGMRTTSESEVIQLSEILSLDSIRAVEVGPYAAIDPMAGKEAEVEDALLRPHDHMNCSKRQDLPERLHYGKNPRVAAIICIAQPGWSIFAGPAPWSANGGSHGYDNMDPDMLALFIAYGTHLRGDIGTVDNIETYPLVARMIGVTPLPSDAADLLAK